MGHPVDYKKISEMFLLAYFYLHEDWLQKYISNNENLFIWNSSIIVKIYLSKYIVYDKHICIGLYDDKHFLRTNQCYFCSREIKRSKLDKFLDVFGFQNDETALRPYAVSIPEAGPFSEPYAGYSPGAGFFVTKKLVNIFQKFFGDVDN